MNNEETQKTAALEGYPVWTVGEYVEVKDGAYRIMRIVLNSKQLILRRILGSSLAPFEIVVIKGVRWEVVAIPGDYILESRGKAKGIEAMMARLGGQHK